MTTLLVIAKSPVPGRVKTRLTPPCTPAEAAALAEAAITDTLHAVLAAPAARRVLVLDGAPGPWLPEGVEVVPQCAGGLDARLAAAFDGCAGPTLLIGMDTPQVSPELLAQAADLGPDDALFGPAEDGGFWALGLGRPDGAPIRGVPMSTPATGAVQRERLHAAGLRVRLLPTLRDVDTAADAESVAATAPHSRFAARWRTVRAAAVRGGAAAAAVRDEATPAVRGDTPRLVRSGAPPALQSPAPARTAATPAARPAPQRTR